MRCPASCSLLSFCRQLCFATDLKIHVVDPDQRPRGERPGRCYMPAIASAVRTTGPDGTVAVRPICRTALPRPGAGAGFAEANRSDQVPRTPPLTISALVEKTTETMVVSAASTPVSEAESGASVSVLDATHWRCATTTG